MSTRGTFIVIEGLDRSGKSTQAAALLQRLQDAKVPAKLIKFPDRTTPIGKMIDAYLKSESDLDDHAIHLLFSANRWELASSIIETLKSGTSIICDRYAFSGIAFSASKIAPEQTIKASGSSSSSTTTTIPPARSILPYDWCRAPDVGLPAPDLTFFLDVSPEQAEARGGYGEERYEKKDLQGRVRQMFDRIREEMEGTGKGSWVLLDADLGKDEVEESIWEAVKPFTDGVDLPIEQLWDTSREKAMESVLYI